MVPNSSGSLTWVEALKKQYTFTADNALELLMQETGKVFDAVLEDVGVNLGYGRNGYEKLFSPPPHIT